MAANDRYGEPRGFFGIGIESPKKAENVGGLWRNAHAFGATFIFTIGHRYRGEASDTTKAWRHVAGFEYETAWDFVNNRPNGAELVAVECGQDHSIALPEFEHPERAVYVLGAEDSGISGDLLPYCDHLVEIPGRYCLNVSNAGAVVLYDRAAKAAQRRAVIA